MSIKSISESQQLQVFHSPVVLGVQAGYPSPAGDYMESPIDLNSLAVIIRK